MQTVRHPSSHISPRPLNRDPAPLNCSPPGLLLLLVVADVVAVVPTGNNDVESTVTGGRLRAVEFTLMFAAVDSFCLLVPLPSKPTLETPPETLIVTDELYVRPYPVR